LKPTSLIWFIILLTLPPDVLIGELLFIIF